MKLDKIVRAIICIIAGFALIIFSKVFISEFYADTGYIISSTIVFIATVAFFARGISLLLSSIIEKKKK